MSKKNTNLFIEINNIEFIFVVVDVRENNEFILLHKSNISSQGIIDKKISDFNLVLNVLKKNILDIEQKLKIVFKEVNLIIENFDCSLINFTGFKKLNGSQLIKENITYILNSLKFEINETEKNKQIIHILNSKYVLDKKEVENLPIGLFGNFYSQELSFFLIDINDFKNLNNILNKCNLKIKKIISKSFLEGVNLINEDPNLSTFFFIQINKYNSKIIFFENSSLKYSQEFDFGNEIIINDISKILGLEINLIYNILDNYDLSDPSKENEIIAQEYFNKKNFRKIKKKLIKEIAEARIQELSEIIIKKNINTSSFLNKKIPIFLKLNINSKFNFFKNNYKFHFSNKNNYKVNLIEKDFSKKIFENANSIVQYGWKREAVPIVNEKKSIISRFFNFIFG